MNLKKKLYEIQLNTILFVLLKKGDNSFRFILLEILGEI